MGWYTPSIVVPYAAAAAAAAWAEGVPALWSAFRLGARPPPPAEDGAVGVAAPPLHPAGRVGMGGAPREEGARTYDMRLACAAKDGSGVGALRQPCEACPLKAPEGVGLAAPKRGGERPPSGPFVYDGLLLAARLNGRAGVGSRDAREPGRTLAASAEGVGVIAPARSRSLSARLDLDVDRGTGIRLPGVSGRWRWAAEDASDQVGEPARGKYDPAAPPLKDRPSAPLLDSRDEGRMPMDECRPDVEGPWDREGVQPVPEIGGRELVCDALSVSILSSARFVEMFHRGFGPPYPLPVLGAGE